MRQREQRACGSCPVSRALRHDRTDVDRNTIARWPDHRPTIVHDRSLGDETESAAKATGVGSPLNLQQLGAVRSLRSG